MADAEQVVRDADLVAERFVTARRRNLVLDTFPGAIPGTLEAAYRVQQAAIAHDGRRVLGWKVGRIPDPLTTQFGTDRLVGPIFAIADARHGETPVMPVLDGFAAAEGELLLRIAPSAARALADNQYEAMVDAVHLGIEIASSPFPGINDHGPTVTIADFGNNHGAVLGPRFEDVDWRDLTKAPMQVAIDGAVAGTARPADVLDGPLGAVAFVLAHLARTGGADPAGLWVSCGAVTGVHQLAAGSSVAVTLLDRQVRCTTIRAAAPA